MTGTRFHDRLHNLKLEMSPLKEVRPVPPEEADFVNWLYRRRGSESKGSPLLPLVDEVLSQIMHMLGTNSKLISFVPLTPS